MKTDSATTMMWIVSAILALFIILLSFISLVGSISTPKQVNVWALLVGGSVDVGSTTYPAHEMFRNNYYMHHVLNKHFGVPANHIMFLYAQDNPPYPSCPDVINDTCIIVDGNNVINNVNSTIHGVAQSKLR